MQTPTLPTPNPPAPGAIPRLVARVYRHSQPQVQARLLQCLLQPVGPLALAALASGAFGSFLYRRRWGELSVQPEDALRISGPQVLELARYVEQSSAEVFQQLGAVLAQNPALLAGLSSTLLLAALSRWRGAQARPVSSR